MRFVLSNAVALAVLVAGAYTSLAQDGSKSRTYDERYYDKYDRESAAYRAFRRLVPGYQARNPDNFKYGSPEWWKAMDLEGRGGHRF